MPNPVGRPTDYTPELLEKAKGYVNGKWRSAGDMIPSHAGLADYLGKGRRLLYSWAEQEDKQEFKHMLDDCMHKQERELVNKGLDGTFNSNITKLVLSKHGYADKTSTELTGANGGAIDMKWTVEIIEPDVKE